jgi:hypothetical protein
MAPPDGLLLRESFPDEEEGFIFFIGDMEACRGELKLLLMFSLLLHTQ